MELNEISGQVVDAAMRVHTALSGKRLGLPINFNVVHLKDGIKRMVDDR